MRRLLIASLMFLGVLVTAPAWSHHAAEGIVSDDIRQMIDGLLEDANSLHLDIDSGDVMDSMAVGMTPGGSDNCNGDNDCSSRMFLETSIVVPSGFVTDYMIYIDFAVADFNRFPSGKTSGGTAFVLEIEISDLGDGWTEISLLEHIGSGQPSDNPVPGDSGNSSSRQP